MRISWKGLLVAPAVAPLCYSVVLTILAKSLSSAIFFLLYSTIFSYAATAIVLLPCLRLFSKFRQPTLASTCFLGALLGTLLYLPPAWILWQINLDCMDVPCDNGPGPPPYPFAQFLGWMLLSPIPWAFLFGGLITAALYWFLARPATRTIIDPGD